MIVGPNGKILDLFDFGPGPFDECGWGAEQEDQLREQVLNLQKLDQKFLLKNS